MDIPTLKDTANALISAEKGLLAMDGSIPTRLVSKTKEVFLMAKEEHRSLIDAAQKITRAAMWLVAHQTYSAKVNFNNKPLEASDFKESPQGHMGGSLNMIPAYVGYMLANAMQSITRGWIMGQGHCVSAIDSVNLLLDNMLPEHSERYSLTEEGLTRFANDFYSYRLDGHGHQDSPLGSHVNVNTAGGCVEGGYLGFVELQYIHMPLPGEKLVVFLSDGAFEEQRGSDWAPHWWRAEDTGFAIPIMIFNGRRIDQRAIISQEKGLSAFLQHLKNYHFDPIVFDGTDPQAFASMIIKAESLLQERTQQICSGANAYPISLPYGVAVAQKGAGFYGAGTNAAHNLPLGANPYTDELARKHFNDNVKKLFVPLNEILEARNILKNHAKENRPLERNHIFSQRNVDVIHPDSLSLEPPTQSVSPMSAIDETFLAYVRANSALRPRVGNPDEILSNHLQKTLAHLKHRVTEVESGMPEAIDGKIITLLNEEAVACACLGNKAGINLIVTYEAFAPKMLGALRQELNWSEHLLSRQRNPGWISVPLVLTSHTYENGKNERSHQDPTLCEALLGEPSNVSRVLFPADYASAAAALRTCYHTHGKIFTFVVPKDMLPPVFSEIQAQQLMVDGIFSIKTSDKSHIILTAIGAYQLQQLLRAADRLHEKGIETIINYMIEPGRFRKPRGRRESELQTSDSIRLRYYPPHILPRVFVSHTHPEIISGVLRPLDSGKYSHFLGFINHGGTLDTGGMLFLNRQTWGHIIQVCADSLELDLSDLLSDEEVSALQGKTKPQGIII